jgi:hypothetical protein
MKVETAQMRDLALDGSGLAVACEGLERRPMRAEARARLLEAIAKARLWLDGLIAGRFTSTAEIALYERCSERAVRITLSLAFLAPPSSGQPSRAGCRTGSLLQASASCPSSGRNSWTS